MAISAEDRAALGALARQAVAAAVGGQARPRPQLAGLLAQRRGCFVTLTNNGRLRGCIGTFHPVGPLGQMVVEMAAAAAVQDPRFRFNPITVSELPHLKVEVSVLSELTPTNQPEKLQVGTHGIYIVRGGQSGCFLPEVATDQGWGAIEFLEQCCAGKAGLPPGAWKMEGTEVYLFTSEKFAG